MLRMLRWADFITPSTLQLAPLVELLLEPLGAGPPPPDLQLGLQEALVNAVRHGNGCDPGKCLRVRRIVTPRWLIWQVQDEGDGINQQQRSRLLPKHCDAIGGRGLFLIHHCFDDVRWSARGNRLQLAVRRDRFSGRGSGSPDR
ncbi:MAG: ATP-binding protein [Synechococcaceae cyanobacterium]|nr:ATP-binding protein [Synechococcaceae cyanobacterium]